MKRFSIIAACLFALVLSTLVFAQNPPVRQGRHHGKLKQMDTNHDGAISRDEWRGKPKKFNKLDQNHDGVITKQELKARHHKGQRPPQF